MMVGLWGFMLPWKDIGADAAVVCQEQFCDTTWFELSHVKTKGRGEKVAFSYTDLLLTA